MTEPSLMVQSEVLPTGSYGVTVAVGADEAFPLTAEQATAYAAGCVAVAMEACHDAAVITALTVRGPLSSSDGAAFVVHELRPGRAADDRTLPLRFVPGISAFTGNPFVRVELRGRALGQLDPQALREHALGVLDVLATTTLDTAVVHALREKVGVDEHQARRFVQDLGEHWPEAALS